MSQKVLSKMYLFLAVSAVVTLGVSIYLVFKATPVPEMRNDEPSTDASGRDAHNAEIEKTNISNTQKNTIYMNEKIRQDTEAQTNENKMVSIAVGETVTVYDLKITNRGGGHEIMLDGTDPSFAEIILQTPRQTEEVFPMTFANTEETALNDLAFDNYSMRVNEVSFNAQSITVTVTQI